MSSLPSPRWRFGPFQYDPDTQQLWQNGRPLPLQQQSLRALALLLTHAGAVVTRRQLQEHLWPRGTEVDVDPALNSIIRRLRRALGDDIAQPRYLATVPGSGYRFIAPAQLEGPADLAAPVPPAAPPARPWLRNAALMATLVLLALGVWAALRPYPQPRVRSVQALTTGGGLDYLAQPVSDGARLYYLQRDGGRWLLMQNTGNPATAASVALPFPNARALDISPDRGEWLLGSFQERGEPAALWRQLLPAGAPIRVGKLFAVDALWYPDGQHLLIANDSALWRARPDGSDLTLLAKLPGDAIWLAWNPRGTTVSFTVGLDLWQYTVGAPAAQRLPAHHPRCCGQWTQDGRYFLYSAKLDGIWTLWAQRQPARLAFWRHPIPVQLTFGPESSWGAFTRFGRNQVVYYRIATIEHPQLFNLGTRQFQPLLPGRSAIQLGFAPDGHRLAFVDTRDGTLWTADISASGATSNFRQLTLPGAPVAFPRWSPDGQWLAASRQADGQPVSTRLVPAQGGSAQALADPPGTDVAFPDWSPDGRQLVVSLDQHLPNGQERYSLAIADRATSRLTPIPGSAGLNAARWSPDGRWLAAFSHDQRRLEIFDRSGGSWRTIATGTAFTVPEWSRDSRFVYFQDLLAPGEPLFRADATAWRPEQIAEFSAQLRGGLHRCGFVSLAPDGSAVISFNSGFADLYRADLDLP